jgi:hypothetical protein
MMPDSFPIIVTKGYEMVCPSSINIAYVQAHEAQCLKNHNKTVEQLRDSGGLSVIELVRVLNDDFTDIYIDDPVEQLWEILRKG